MPITMKDHAWVWMNWDRGEEVWIVDCPDCGKLELPGTIPLAKVEPVANLHNARNHGGGHDAD